MNIGIILKVINTAELKFIIDLTGQINVNIEP